jgi:hypothetical protein
MSGENRRKKRSSQISYLIMGFVWIAIALFGLIFDPEKKLVIISLFAAGGLFIVIFIVMKLKKSRD